MNILLIGLGGMGKVHYANASDINGFNIIGVVGKGDFDRKEAEKRALPFFSGIDEALKAFPDIDAVDITTPTFLHKDYALEAISRNIDVICEKPLALSTSDASQIFRAAEEKGRRVYCAQVLRYTKEYSPIRKTVESGKYGAVVDAVFSRMSAYPEWATGSWLSDKSKSGLVPFDLHIHDLDIIVSSFGKPLGVSSSESTKCGDYWSFCYDYGSFKVHAEAGWIKAPIPFSATYRIIFERGVLTYDGSSLKMYEEGGEVVNYDISYDKIISTGINVPPTGWYYEELKEILSLLSEKKESNVKYSEILDVLGILEKF